MSTHGNRTERGRWRAVATVATATALVAVPLTLSSTMATAAEAHVDNPYAGAKQYVNPTWAATVESAATRAGDPTLAAQMRTVAKQPTAVWMDRISAINGNADGNGLKFHLDEAVKQKTGSTPLVFNLVIYNLPGRDCFALASNGELPASDAGLARYKTEYIDPIVDLLSDSKYADIRIAATIEPDSLPNLVTNMSEATCQASAPYYREGVKYALDELKTLDNVYTYLDAAHSGWLGWDSNSGPTAKLFAEVAKSTKKGFASIDGFVTNTANSTPLAEPFLPDPTLNVGGNPVRSSKFYEWNSDFGEHAWTAQLHRLLVAEGFPSSTGMLIDTSRNGWGGPDRPTKVSTSTNLETYVNESRIDRRTHRGAWCNPLGAGIGELPVATPSSAPAAAHLDAYVWIKPPGESDGASKEIPNDQGKSFDRMCDPTYVASKLANNLTGATPDAPLAGQWFEAQFTTLVKNAYPVIPTSGATPGPTPSVTPSPSVTTPPPPVTPSPSVTTPPPPVTPSPSVTTPPPVTPSPTANPAGACSVTYTANSWNNGFTASVKVTNRSSSALSGWNLKFTFANGQQVQQGWSATWSQSGSTVTATNAAWNGTLAAGGSVDIGFNGSHSGTNTAPTAFTLNGATCTIG
ncbi:glycoside hydrolase family 6 protein [Cellulomonas sp. zg-ZUI222]|uniref:glycoside hydrolase family 6 protein n=1 Tax=Cellulomonas TaxID=1707 RepID=UPI001A953F27|nr:MULTISPECIES: glycoside hydrolase family 6 protein [Cellulomonas]MBO0900306.1 glycoside hydrolase family 6 protein [Cellulomonas sp. zg-ZUI22]MBO0920780.1 glycoside hydrolase family 6 protein [Cellulomonas wangleii]